MNTDFTKLTPAEASAVLADQTAAIDLQMKILRSGITRLRDERDDLRAALKDIAAGATMLLDGNPTNWPDSALHFANEVRRVAKAAVS
jgi:hypothetical protein